MSTAPRAVVSVAWASAPSYPGAFVLDHPTRGVLDSVTYTLADDARVALTGLQSVTANSGRSGRYDAPTAGTLTATFLDPERELDPNNAAGPYYGVLESRRPLALTTRVVHPTTGATVDVPTWAGYVDDIAGAEQSGRYVATITAVDAIGLLSFTVPRIPTASRPAETVADRLRYLFGLIGFAIPEGTIDAGRTVAPAELGGANALALARALELADNGRLYVDAAGAWCYISALTDNVASFRFDNEPSFDTTATPPVTPLEAAPVSSQMARYWNSVTATRTGGIPQTTEDPDAILEFGRRAPSPFTDLPLVTDDEALELANRIFVRARERRPRPVTITLNLAAWLTLGAADGTVCTVGYVAGRLAELLAGHGQTADIFHSYIGGDSAQVQSTGTIDKVTVTAGPGRYAATVTFSPIFDPYSSLELGAGVLDYAGAGSTSARLGY